MDKVRQELSSYAATLAYDELTAEAVHGMKRCLVDSLACAAGAARAEPCTIARNLASQHVSLTPAQVLFYGERTTPELAAFTNSLMVRYLDCNDTYRVKEGGHPSDTIPAVLAVADARHSDGPTTLVGLIAAYEVFAALSFAEALGPVGIDHAVHTAVASAAGAGCIMDLDEEAMANAISMALVPNVGLRIAREGRLSMWKGAAAPNAARNGVFAAQLAELGMTGPEEPWTGSSGLARLLAEAPVLRPMGGRGTPFQTPFTNMKFFPAEYHSQAPIWAALELRQQVDPSELASLSIFTYEFAYNEIGAGEAKWHVSDRETADHSLPYLVAAALFDGDIGQAQFSPERIGDPAIHELMSRIQVFEDPALTAQYPGVIATRIEATSRSGAGHVVEHTYPKGHVRNPLSDDELVVKFSRFSEGLLPKETQQRALNALWNIDKATDVSEVIATLRV